MADFNRKLKELRINAGLTQDELAKRLGVSKSAVSMYERGERRPDFDLLEQIGDFFAVDVAYLVGSSNKVTRLTGTHADEESLSSTYVMLNDEERAIMKAYRMASEEIRAAVRAVLKVQES